MGHNIGDVDIKEEGSKLVFGECRHRFGLNSDASVSGTFCAFHCIVLEDIASRVKHFKLEVCGESSTVQTNCSLQKKIIVLFIVSFQPIVCIFVCIFVLFCLFVFLYCLFVFVCTVQTNCSLYCFSPTTSPVTLPNIAAPTETKYNFFA